MDRIALAELLLGDIPAHLVDDHLVLVEAVNRGDDALEIIEMPEALRSPFATMLIAAAFDLDVANFDE